MGPSLVFSMAIQAFFEIVYDHPPKQFFRADGMKKGHMAQQVERKRNHPRLEPWSKENDTYTDFFEQITVIKGLTGFI